MHVRVALGAAVLTQAGRAVDGLQPPVSPSIAPQVPPILALTFFPGGASAVTVPLLEVPSYESECGNPGDQRGELRTDVKVRIRSLRGGDGDERDRHLLILNGSSRIG